MKSSKKVIMLLLLLCTAVIGFTVWWSRRPRTVYNHYRQIISAKRIVAVGAEGEQVLPVHFEGNGVADLSTLEKLIRVSNEDVEEGSRISFTDKNGKTIASAVFCRFLHPENYPEEALVMKDGKAYGFFAQNLFYKNMLYFFPPSLAEQLTELLETQ